ncbi:hypothetical protein ABFY60_00265 [Lysinibacillus pakistanensis]|uniref:hypothetical protein n=1 Tax=Lysinibacillus pakistanensis TaxID=759811 RepID=UPI003D2679AC
MMSLYRKPLLNWTSIPTSAVVYNTVEVDCKNMFHANELLKKCEEALSLNRQAYGASVVELHLKNIDEHALIFYLNMLLWMHG